MCKSCHICAEQWERGQEGPGSSLRGSGRRRLRVLLCHGLPASPLGGTWASPLPNSPTVQLLVSNRYPQMPVPVQESFLQLGLSQTGKKKLYLRQKRSVLTGRSSPWATSLHREAFGYVSLFSSLKWGQSRCFSTPRRNKFKIDVNVICTQTIMALR